MKKFKVVLAGASGSGKTTLAKGLAEHYGWVFEENSAGLIISDDDKHLLKTIHGYGGNWGQQKVINKSHEDMNFGTRFQNSVLNARYVLMHKYQDEDCIFDRSSLDPIVFWLNQVSHNSTQEETEQFIQRCVAGMRDVDMVLRIPLQNPEQRIENNGSRVPNWYFQKKVDGLFDTACELVTLENQKSKYLLGGKVIRFTRCPGWDWNLRLSWAIQMVNRLRSEVDL